MYPLKYGRARERAVTPALAANSVVIVPGISGLYNGKGLTARGGVLFRSRVSAVAHPLAIHPMSSHRPRQGGPPYAFRQVDRGCSSARTAALALRADPPGFEPGTTRLTAGRAAVAPWVNRPYLLRLKRLSFLPPRLGAVDVRFFPVRPFLPAILAPSV